MFPVKPKPRMVTWEEFEKRYLPREDAFKYEWTDGTVEKTPRTMNLDQLYIQDNLAAFLSKKEKMLPRALGGKLYAETNTFLTKGMYRRPDMAYFTADQIKAAAHRILLPVPEFVIEVISPTDNYNRVGKKVREYFLHGIKLLWHIVPALEEVHIYTNPNGSVICREDDLCSFDPVFPGLAISVKDIFKKP